MSDQWDLDLGNLVVRETHIMFLKLFLLNSSNRRMSIVPLKNVANSVSLAKDGPDVQWWKVIDELWCIPIFTLIGVIYNLYHSSLLARTFRKSFYSLIFSWPIVYDWWFLLKSLPMVTKHNTEWTLINLYNFINALTVELSPYQWNLKRIRISNLNVCGLTSLCCECLNQGM